MAELIVSSLAEAVVSHTIGRISDLLAHESQSLAAVSDDVETLRKELWRIQCFLRSPCGQPDHPLVDQRVRNWVAEIRNVACEIEDVLDVFVVKSEASYAKPFRLRGLRRKIERIKGRIKSIFDSKKVYDIKFVAGDPAAGATASPSAAQLRRSYRDEDGDEDEDENGVIGQEVSVAALKGRVLEEREWLCAIPIVGMGGLGKTTHAKKVFSDVDVKRRFDCRAWVLISQEFVARDVFSEILFQISFSPPRSEEVEEEKKRERERLKSMEEDELVRMIRARLRGRRCLVVFDDVWRVDDMVSVVRIFHKDNKGSKVVFTTQMMEVATSVDPNSSPIQPPFLTPEESWELLHQKAFPNDIFGERRCPPEFELMGKEIVKRCGGLPLAIVVLGGLLRTKNSEDEWRKVEKDVDSHLSRHRFGQQYGVGEMLALSYYYLPFYLKPCFLYLGNFPEDMEIPRRKLIQLWIAEGLVIEPTTRRGRTLEEIGEQFLRELIDRCMVQVGNRDHTAGGGVKTCRVHHLMRDFCVSKAREDGFSEVIRRHEIKERSPSSSSFTTKTRRIAIHPGCTLHPRQMHAQLRSLMCFEVSSPDLLGQYVRSKNLRLLRVLEFEFKKSTIQKCKVPPEIGDLIHLRYLGLRDGGKVKLPSSIGNLRSLRTLNLRHNKEVVLPVEILRLKRLKHLLLPLFGTSFPHAFSWATYALSDTTYFQTVKYIGFAQFLLKNKMVQSEFSSLRNLGVDFKSNEEVRLFLASPNFDFGVLHSLHMSFLSSAGVSGLQPLSQCAVLSKLFLDGKIFYDCHGLEFLPASLTKLILRDSGLREDPMPVLERLPNLRLLRLQNAFVGTLMVCNAGGFPKLETLQLLGLEEVTEWRVSEKAMASLKRLYINMPKLKKIPERLQSLNPEEVEGL